MAWYDELTTTELTTMKTNALAAINEVLTGGQAMHMEGRTLTMADLPELRKTLEDVTQALADKGNTGRQVQRAIPVT